VWLPAWLRCKGVPIQDIWLDYLDPYNQNSKITGYPTEKNAGLLTRIIKASSTLNINEKREETEKIEIKDFNLIASALALQGFQPPFSSDLLELANQLDSRVII
jgi:hypothetical protein